MCHQVVDEIGLHGRAKYIRADAGAVHQQDRSSGWRQGAAHIDEIALDAVTGREWDGAFLQDLSLDLHRSTATFVGFIA